MPSINRRDFLGGVLATGATLATSSLTAAEAQSPATPPPAHPKADPHFASSAIDFRYAPLQSQTAFCFPDDPFKSLVNQAGQLLYGYDSAASVSYFPLKIGFALNGMQTPKVLGQQLENPSMPIVRTALEYPGISVLLTTFATNFGRRRPGRQCDRRSHSPLQRIGKHRTGNHNRLFRKIRLRIQRQLLHRAAPQIARGSAGRQCAWERIARARQWRHARRRNRSLAKTGASSRTSLKGQSLSRLLPASFGRSGNTSDYRLAFPIPTTATKAAAHSGTPGPQLIHPLPLQCRAGKASSSRPARATSCRRAKSATANSPFKSDPPATAACGWWTEISFWKPRAIWATIRKRWKDCEPRGPGNCPAARSLPLAAKSTGKIQPSPCSRWFANAS